MTTEELDKSKTNYEAAQYAIADREQTQRKVLLWQAPTIVDADIPDAVGIPYSLWAEQKRQGDTPPLFMIGRRLFVRTDDLRAWLDAKAKGGRPGSKPRRAQLPDSGNSTKTGTARGA